MKKHREDMPILAICYDFDKTLSPDDMQAQGYIQEVYKGNVNDFWKECGDLALQNGMDTNLAYMYKMVQEAEGKIVFTRKTLEEYGAKVTLFPGVEQWFERIRHYGRKQGVIVEHYIISAGLKEMIEGTSVAKAGAFEQIYASSFLFNEKGIAVWPAQTINYTNKTQFLFRIQKGVLDVNDPSVNAHFPPESLRVPFRNMVYIGDSDTDVPCMKLVNSNGGHAIGVYNAETRDKHKVFKMMRENRIKYFVPADYAQDSPLDRLVKDIIRRTALNERLEAYHTQDKSEMLEHDRQSSEEERTKDELVIALESSYSFARTHKLIARMSEFSQWSQTHKEALFKIAATNRQVFYVLGDADLSLFYQSLLDSCESLSPYALTVKKALDTVE